MPPEPAPTRRYPSRPCLGLRVATCRAYERPTTAKRPGTPLFYDPSMIRMALVAALSVPWLAGCAGDAPRVEWDEAASHIGERARVCGPVAGVGHDKNDSFINLGVNYPDPARFTIVAWDDPDAGDDLAVGSRICVDGEISSYEGLPQIEANDGDWESDSR